MSKLIEYQNGNTTVQLFEDGTRILEFDGCMKLDTPLNIDIRVSTKCSFGFNPETGKSVCGFCHETNLTNGMECDYEVLMSKLNLLPAGIELAIGSNELTKDLYEFLVWCKSKGFICNITVNQGHLRRDLDKIKDCIDNGLIKGLGVSYRTLMTWDIPQEILDYEHTVFHVIVGIDIFNEVTNLKKLGVKKILCLGEKDFGLNKGKVNLESNKHHQWVWWVHSLFDMFDVVSFDNLALEQLRIRRFFTKENWETFNNGEHSMYINAVEGYYAPSSRSDDKVRWVGLTIEDFFKDSEDGKYNKM